jgi:glycosyltransferase involved in cell wall biosynthesis
MTLAPPAPSSSSGGMAIPTLPLGHDPDVAPVLDVLIPHFRDPGGLAASLASVAAQDWLGRVPAGQGPRLRVVVVDDGSPPEDLAAARAACDAFRATSGQALHLEALPQNLGRPGARNRLLDLARAPYLAWLDAGDIWYPPRLSVQFAHLAALEAQGHDPRNLWVSCAYDWDQHGRRMSRRQDTSGDQFRALLIGEGLRAYLWTLLARADAVRIAGRFDPRLSRLQDLDHFLTFLRAGGRITVPADPAPLCCYFKSDIGRDAAQVAACYQLILAKSAPLIRFYPRHVRRALAHKSWMLPARFARSNGDARAAAGYIARAVLASPVESAALVWRRALRGVARQRPERHR